MDAILRSLRNGDPGGQPPSPDLIGGYLTLTINTREFTRRYDRVGTWGPTLGRLEQLLKPPAP